MRTREVLSSASRGTGSFESVAARANQDAAEIRYVIRMSQAQLENPENRFDFAVYGSLDNWVTRVFLGGAGGGEEGLAGWQGGTYVNKQGQTVAMPPPSVTIEATPSVKEMDLRARVESYRNVRWSLEIED